MGEMISVKSTIAQVSGFDVETDDVLLLQNRYFPTAEGDLFAGQEVLFDFEDRDLEKGAYLTTTYKDGRTVNWRANAVIPPRVAVSDSVDPKGLDRQLFERLCRAAGADLDRASVFQDLLTIKAARLARRVERSQEELCSLLLKSGAIQFLQPKSNAVGADDDVIDVTYYNTAKGANNKYLLKTAWGQTGATPYKDVCNMVDALFAHGSYAEDVLMGVQAWQRLNADPEFEKYYTAFHTEDAVLFAREVDRAQHVGTGIFNGRKFNLIVYSGCYKNSAGVLVPFINTNAVAIIAPDAGRTLCGGVTLLNPNRVEMLSEGAFQDGRGRIIESIYKDFNANTLEIRAESRPLPAPNMDINNIPWVYCDTAIADSTDGGTLGAIITLSYVYQDATGEEIEPTSGATQMVNKLGGSKQTIAAPVLSGYTFDGFYINNVKLIADSAGKYTLPNVDSIVVAKMHA